MVYTPGNDCVENKALQKGEHEERDVSPAEGQAWSMALVDMITE